MEFLLPLGHWHCNGAFWCWLSSNSIIGSLGHTLQASGISLPFAYHGQSHLLQIPSSVAPSGARTTCLPSRMLQKYYSIQEPSVSSLVWPIGTSGLWSCMPERHTHHFYSHIVQACGIIYVAHNWKMFILVPLGLDTLLCFPGIFACLQPPSQDTHWGNPCSLQGSGSRARLWAWAAMLPALHGLASTPATCLPYCPYCIIVCHVSTLPFPVVRWWSTAWWRMCLSFFPQALTFLYWDIAG